MHSICTPDQRDSFAYLQWLSSTLFATDADLGSKLEALFAEETAEFGIEGAFCSRIDREAGTQQYETVHGADDVVVAGESVPLETTYCRETIDRPDGTMAITDAEAESWADDPAYEEWGFGSYLGTTVTVDGDLYGTLCYVDPEPRDDPIQPEEEALVEIHGQFVSHQLAQWSEEPPQESVEVVEEGPDISPERIDTMMDALGSRERRAVLLSLLAAGRDDRVAYVERRLDGDHVRITLYHTHLPRLEQAGYVTYDHDTGTIERGPDFAEVEPLVRLLWEYTT